MRWFVEISPLGSKASSTTTLCVEAPQWQPALQKARALQGDSGALSNFSIELLDDGFRAIDPSTRLRYVVRRAPDDAKLSEAAPGVEPKPPANSSPPPAASPAKKQLNETVAYASAGEAAIAGVPAKAPSVPPAAEPVKKRPPADTLAYSSTGAAAVREQLEEKLAAEEAPRKDRPLSSRIAIPLDPVPPPPAAALPEFKVLGKREDNPSEKSPLHYREMVYAVAPGTAEEEGRRLILDRFEHVQASIASAPRGKLINLAVFDHVFQGKPQKRPLVTLTWKDWKSDPPEIHFPQRDANTPRVATPSTPPASMPPASPAAGPTLSSAKPEVVPVVVPVPEVPVVESSQPRRVSEPPPAAPKSAPPPPLSAEPEAPKSASVPPTKVIPTVASPAAAAPASSPPPAPKAEPASSARLKSGAVAVSATKPSADVPPAPVSKRFSGEELLTELFEAFGDLHFLRDSLEGAEFVLALTLEKLPSEVGLVSLFDMNKREFVIVRQSGGPRSALCARQPERAQVAFSAMRKKHALVLADPTAAARAMDDRWKAIGVELKSVICAPVELSGRFLGLIEIANPLDGHSYNEGDGNALTYIGQQFAEFVGERGIIVDAEAIREAAEPPAPVPAPVKSAPKSAPKAAPKSAPKKGR